MTAQLHSVHDMTTERFATQSDDLQPETGNVGTGNASAADFQADATSCPVAEVAARLFLDQIMARVGVDGLVESLRSPGLLATVDQHAAAVRESLAAAGRFVDPTSLAGYARSVLAVAERHGRELPDGADLDWAKAEWFVLRLVGVCSLADRADCF
jgi:hypothetical protein